MFKKTFLLFSVKEGNQHIAKEFALKGIEKIAKNKNVKYVFEFGIGIGTIPYLLSNLNKEIIYYGTEANEFCIKQFKKNLEFISAKFKFNPIKFISDYSENFDFDFIIIDGSFNDVDFLKRIVNPNTIILVEGDREPQRKFIKEIFPKALESRVISLKRNEKHSPFYSSSKSNFEGGYSLFRLNSSFGSKYNWFFEKVSTFLKYKIRKII
jgi:16S rRNA G1207 methylase RsmC